MAESFGSALQSMIQRGISAAASSVFMGRSVDIAVNPVGPAHSAPFNMSVEDIWASQPHVRTVVDFQARNIAQLGLHHFTTEGEERQRVRGSEAHQTLSRPNPHMTGTELIYDLVATRAVWGDAFWYIYPGRDGQMQIQPFPPSWVSSADDGFSNAFGIDQYMIRPPGQEKYVVVPASSMIRFKGWRAGDFRHSLSPIETIRDILEERHHSRKYRIQLWRKNGRVATVIQRPQGAPEWDPKARRRFYEMWEAFTGEHGSRAGSAPLLEDGMTLAQQGFKSADEQWAESEKLSLETVAQVYQVNPTMVGILDNANYSNVREFNKQLYTNTLGPELRLLEARINAFVLPLIGGLEDEFVEFNVAEKLRGSFEEQASIMSTSTGAPWLTRNEARRLQNLPPLEGGDELIVPLNVAEGGQASPQDGGDGRPADPMKASAIWKNMLQRQLAAVPGKMSGPNWWDAERWDRELTADLAVAGVPDPGGLAKAYNARTYEALNGDREHPVAVFNALLQEVPE